MAQQVSILFPNFENEKIEYKINTDIENIKTQIDELYFNSQMMLNKITDIFSEVDSSDIQNLVSAIENSEIDEGKIMKAYIESNKE